MVRASAARKSPPRRQGVLGAAGLLLAAAIALPPIVSRAQTPAPDTGTHAPDTGTRASDIGSDLLQPKLQGSAKTLPRFRRPGTRSRQSTAADRKVHCPLAHRCDADPSPPALGAGEIGYDSTNNRRRKKPAQPSTTPGGTPAGAPPQPQTTFTPVPTYARPTPPKKPGAKNRRRRRSTRSEPQRGRARHCRRPPSPCR
jgi:hypothetical protein